MAGGGDLAEFGECLGVVELCAAELGGEQQGFFEGDGGFLRAVQVE